MGQMTRRWFLQQSAMRGAGLAALAALPPSLACQAEKAPRRGDLSQVAHVVIFMQENRSFDHYFGTLSGVRGYADRHPLSLAGGGHVFAQPAPDGVLWPFRLNSLTTSGQCVPDVNHDWFTGGAARHDGRMDFWTYAKGNNALGYYNRQDLPFHYALADAFTLCDHSFCSVNTSTNPNRLYLWTGTVDAAAKFQGPVMSNDAKARYTWTTYPERLEAAGVTWRVYQEEDNFDDNALAWFANFQDAPKGSSLYENGMKRRSRSAFLDDVANDTLPTVSWIIAPTDLSEHAKSAPNKGADLTKLYLDALAKNPAVWDKTVFIYTMDENGGFFDHVVPPTAPLGTPDEYAGDASIGLGVRVPTLVISPFSTGGVVCSEVFDHTSILRFLEKVTGVQEPNISAWRRSVCGDMLATLNFDATPAGFPAGLPATAPLVEAANTACATLPPAVSAGETTLPTVEAGTRPLRPLPYQPDARCTTDGLGQVIIALTNAGTRAFPVDIHGLAGVDDLPRFLTVAAGGTDQTTFTTGADGKYEIEVHGVNAFFRRFVGSALAAGGDPVVTAVLDHAGGTAQLTVQNPGKQPLTVLVDDLTACQTTTLTIAAGATQSLALVLDERWYDATARVVSSGFATTLAGHLEGAESRTRGLARVCPV